MAGPVEYRAPASPPNPNTVMLRATSEQQESAQGTAAITISMGPFLSGVLPASLFAGAANSFGLRVEGVQLVPTNPGPGTIISINGTARVASCPSTTECDLTLDPGDVATAGTLTVSALNPGTPPMASNPLNLIVASPQTTEDVITLDSGNPVATGKDIYVVEPTLAGSVPPQELSLLEIGQIDPASGACSLDAGPMPLARPVNGSVTLSLCLFGTSLDQVTQVTFSSSKAADLAVTGLNSSLGSLALEFTVMLPATAAPGLRTLFVETANQDRASLTGAVEVK
jgi:hypothetical protein